MNRKQPGNTPDSDEQVRCRKLFTHAGAVSVAELTVLTESGKLSQRFLIRRKLGVEPSQWIPSIWMYVHLGIAADRPLEWMYGATNGDVVAIVVVIFGRHMRNPSGDRRAPSLSVHQ